MIEAKDIANAVLYISKKLDELKSAFSKDQKISIDLGEAGSAFKDASKEMSGLMEKMEKIEGKKEAGADALIKAGAIFSIMNRTLGESQIILEKIAQKDIVVPTELRSTLSALLEAMRGMKPEKMDKFDYKPFTRLETLLGKILSELNKKKDDSDILLLGRIARALEALKIEIPKTIKLDDMQLRQLSNVSGAGGGGSPTNGVLYDGRKEVSVTNTAVKLATDALCEEVFITALTDNADVIVIGGPNVVFTEAARTGRSMNPGDSIMLKVRNLNKIYVNGTSGDGVAFTYTA